MSVVVRMAGVFDIELHDVETVEVDSEDDVIQVEEVCMEFSTEILIGVGISVSRFWGIICGGISFG